ncbi:MAG: response regulator [Campylobacterales bacterium]|nr:response regulator [Campylobacterales bacterium]
MSKVLIVDDSSMIRKLVKKSFATIDIQGDDICEAGDGNEAIEQMMLAEDNLSLIITDINMPGMNGIDFVKMVRKNPEYASCHIIVLSSVINDETVSSFGDFRVDNFLKKPFNQDNFEKIIVPALMGGEIIKSLEELFDKYLKDIDTKSNNITFNEEFVKKCYSEAEAGIDIEETLETIVTKKLRLTPKDTIHITDSQITVERFVDLERLKRATVKKFQTTHMKNSSEEVFVKTLMKKILDKEIDFRTISGEDFLLEKNNIIDNAITTIVQNSYKANEDEAKIFTKYLVEKHNKLIYKLICENVINWLGRNNQAVVKFINNYSGGIKQIGKMKYQIPIIVDRGGKRIQTNDILVIAKRVVQLNVAIDKSSDSLKEIKEDIEALKAVLEEDRKELSYLLSTTKVEDKKAIDEAKKKVGIGEQEIESLEKAVKAQERTGKPYLEQFSKIKSKYNELITSVANALSSEVVITDKGRWYQQDFITDVKVIDDATAKKLLKNNLDMNVKHALDNGHIFDFVILNKSNDKNKTSPMREILQIVFQESKYKTQYNFNYMDTYDNFKLANFVTPVREELEKKFNDFIEFSYSENPKKSKSILSVPTNKNKINKIAKDLVIKYKNYIAELVADSFMEAISKQSAEQIEKPDNKVSALLEGAIKGSDAHPSILLSPENTQAANSLQPVWMRIKQAQKSRDNIYLKAESEYRSCLAKEEGFQLSLDALDKASKLSMNDIEPWTFEKLRDYTINYEDECKEEKRLLQYVPSGELTDTLRARAEKGKLAATSDIAKEEYDRTYKFMELLHANNTAKTLDYKKEELTTNRDKAHQLTQKYYKTYKTEQEKKVSDYDEDLTIIYRSVIYNVLLTA